MIKHILSFIDTHPNTVVFCAFSIILLALALFLRSLPQDTDWYDRQKNFKQLSTNIRYFKDEETKLCFAISSIAGSSPVIVTVPCTKEVEVKTYY